MNRWLTGVDAKLDRAKRHSEELRDLIERSCNPSPYEIVEETDLERGEHVLKRVIVRDMPAAEIGAVLGDCAFDLRSALDNLVCGLIEAHGHEIEDHHQFRIAQSPGHFESQRSNYGSLPEQAIDAIESLQPYHRYDDADLAEFAGVHPVGLICELNRLDKHRIITPVLTVQSEFGFPGNNPQMVFRDVEFIPGRHWFNPSSGPPYDGQVVARLPFRVTGPDPKIEAYPDSTYDVAFESEGPGMSNSVVTFIPQAYDFFAGPVRDRLARCFP